MELMEAKIVAIITLTLGSILVGLLPSWLSNYGRSKYPLLLSGLLCFGAGVLLSTSLVHMLPEIRENMPKYKDYAEILFVCGFFVLYLIDEIVHFIFGMHRHTSSRKEEEKRPLLYPQLPYNPNFENPMSSALLQKPESQICHIGHEEVCRNSKVGSFGLLLALSIHAVLEGLAVGLETSAAKVLLLFAAISSHKFVVVFCLGVELSAESTVLNHFVSIILFSFGSPLGIGLGMIFSDIPKNIEKYLLPILQGLAGGTLFYVSVSEVLPRERARWHKSTNRNSAGMLQFFSVATGFILMTFLTKYMDMGH